MTISKFLTKRFISYTLLCSSLSLFISTKTVDDGSVVLGNTETKAPTVPICQTYSFDSMQVKASFVPMSDTLPLRYWHHEYRKDEPSDDEWIFEIDAMYRYSQNYHQKNVSTMLFQNNPMKIGNDTTIISEKKITQIAFPIAQQSQSSISHQLSINNNYLDIIGNAQYTDWYLTAAITIQRNSSKICFNEQSSSGTGTLSQGYSLEDECDGAPESNYFTTPKPASEIKPVKNVSAYLNGTVVKGMKPHNFAKVNRCPSPAWGVPGITVQLGWDGLKRDTAHLGIYARSLIPTGTNLNNCWAMNTASSFAGNGRSFEIGLGFNSHIDIWKGKNDQSVTFVADGYFVHGFASNQWRTFDFTTGPLTRYGNVKLLTGINDNWEYKGLYWGADLTTQCVNVSIPVRGELLCSIEYENDNSLVEIGYSFKGQQGEKISCMPQITKDGMFFLSNQTQVNTPQATTGATAGWTNSYITPHSGMYLLSTQDVSLFSKNPFGGIAADSNAQLDESSINISSGLMGAQILNSILIGYTYTWDEAFGSPYLGIKGSIGMSPKMMYTPEIWDLGIRFGMDF